MEKEFIPYSEALALKELGFDEPCFAWFILEGDGAKSTFIPEKCPKQDIGLCLAPTFSQAFRWFREKYGLHQYIKQYYGERFYFHIEDMVHPRRFDEYTVEMLRSFSESTSQEEAELECLKKLIEIVKQKKD